MSIPQVIEQLIERYDRNKDEYRSPNYNEANLRSEFLDPMFEALGWDVQNKAGKVEAYKDVIIEYSLIVESSTKVT